MTDKEKITDILKAYTKKHNISASVVILEEYAEELLANGVIVLPCQKGAVLNRNGEKCIANHWNIILTAFNEDNHVRLFDIKEAEAKLRERKEDEGK
jgi:hypothetical protein